MRSRYRCSMCPAIHINSRSWLRSSSTHEPSDPPLRVVFVHTANVQATDGRAAKIKISQQHRGKKREPVKAHERVPIAQWREATGPRENRTTDVQTQGEPTPGGYPARLGSLWACFIERPCNTLPRRKLHAQNGGSRLPYPVICSRSQIVNKAFPSCISTHTESPT